ncbi:RNA polymerase sigma-70 factor, ECF subfamily [bacterium A37T11]|nr:RNA polymerase sigma-70 factor, ECF subfamily [bacterium A37T11]
MHKSTFSHLSDQDLISQLKSGKEGAFSEIFSRYHDLMYDFVYKKTHNTDDAKDIVQEVFIRFWNQRAVLEVHTSLSSYLYKAMLNGVLNNLKQQQTREQHVQSLQQWIDTTSPEADHQIREKEMEALLAKEVAALPPRMREVFELRQKYFLSNREIAQHTGLSEQTVETHMKRALRALRNRLRTVITLLCMLHGL